MAKKLTSAKAKEILHDKSVHGKPLTEKQRKFFGAIAGGAEPYKAQIGTMLTALPSNMMDRLSDALAFPQRAITKLFTGEYQTPSEAMKIQNPVGAAATDILLDPVNLLGAGLAGKASKATKATKAASSAGKKSVVYTSDLLSDPRAEKAMTEGYISSKRNIDRFSKTREALRDNEAWRFSPEDLKRYKAQQALEEDMRLYHGIHPEPVINLQKLNPESVLFDMRKSHVKEFKNVPGGSEWKSSASPYVSKSEMAKFKTYEDFLKSKAKEKYKELVREYPKDYKISPLEFMNLPKNENGGWLDKFDTPLAQNGIEGTMGGLTDKGFNYNGAWGGTMQNGGKASADSVRHQANKILQYEQLRGGPGGTPLPYYSDPKYMNMLMGSIYPEVKKILPNASAIEAGEAMDFVFNAGWDQSGNKITKDPRAYALQEYYRQNDPSKLDADGKWSGRKNPAYSFDQEYNATIGKLPENERRIFMNKGRDWYYKNINNPSPGVPNSNYYDTWYGRIWNTNDYQPFNPNNPKFIPKKQDGGNLMPPMAGANQTVPMAQLGDSIKPIPMQLAMGGSLPGATGMMYARTINPAPSNGPYAKKTKASAQNGQEMKFYQEGLDFTPKTISQDGSAITTDINDYRRWQDSVRNYIRGQKDLAKARADVKKNLSNFSLMSGSGLVGAFSNLIQGDYQGKRRFLPKYTEQSLPRQYWGPSQYPQVPKDVIVVGDPGFDTSRKIKGLTEALEENKNLTETNVLPYSAAVEIYHPPVRKSLKYQPPVKKQQTSRTIGPFPLPESKKLAKPIPIPRDTRDLGYTLPTPGQFTAPELYKYNPDTPTKFSFTYPTGGYNEQKTIYFPTRSAWKSYVEGIKGTEKFKGSQEGVDYAQATGYLQDGGDIPVDPMGYWNPENVGNPVTIPSNIITMEGVDQPLLGISDTGDVQYMEPGEDYEFDGEYVTEYPVAKGGVSVNNADAQPLKKLDQLFNFTNYNKPTKGGWLDKYN